MERFAVSEWLGTAEQLLDEQRSQMLREVGQAMKAPHHAKFKTMTEKLYEALESLLDQVVSNAKIVLGTELRTVQRDQRHIEAFSPDATLSGRPVDHLMYELNCELTDMLRIVISGGRRGQAEGAAPKAKAAKKGKAAAKGKGKAAPKKAAAASPALREAGAADGDVDGRADHATARTRHDGALLRGDAARD